MPDDITFKTKDGNNVYIDVNVMWRIDPKKAGYLVSNVGQSVDEIKERLVRPISRSVIRDVFNEITSEEYYQVTVKNRDGGEGQGRSSPKELDALRRSSSTCSRSSSTASTPSTRRPSTPRSRPRPTSRRSSSSRRTWRSRSRASWRASAREWNQQLEDALGEAGPHPERGRRLLPDEDQRGQGDRSPVAQAEAEGVRKEAEAPRQAGRRRLREDAGRQAALAEEDPASCPGTNVSTMDVNEMVELTCSARLPLHPRPSRRRHPLPRRSASRALKNPRGPRCERRGCQMQGGVTNVAV